MRLSKKQTLLDKIKKIPINYCLLAFCIPFFSLLFLLVIGQYEPFGNARALLYSDMYHQYYPFFVNFRKNLLEGNSLLYNWDFGMGLDYLGLSSYYLASPLNLLSVFVPESLTLEYFSLLMPLKLSFASLFFAIFLKKTFNRNDISISLFGGFYGLCAWAVGYQWNVMWLDTFALLPLVVLGTLALLKERKFLLYTLTLFLSIVSNYYIGLFTCIFVFLLFFVYQICRFGGFKKLLIDLALIALFSALAIGMTAILELPTLAALKTTQSSENQFPAKFALNIVDSEVYQGYNLAYDNYKAALESGVTADIFKYGFEAFTIAAKALWDGMRQIAGNLGGGVTPTFKEGLPNIYCGVGTLVLAVLFLFSGKVKVCDKLCSVFLLLLFVLSFLIRQLDYSWHGFHFTNMIPYRFSFLFSFVLLYMAYRAWLIRESFHLWQILAAGALCIALFSFSSVGKGLIYTAYNLVFLTLFLAALMLPHLQRKLPEDADAEDKDYHRRMAQFNRQVSLICLCAIIGIEIIFHVINFGVNFPYTTVSNYPKGTTYSASMIRYMNQRDDELFFRSEVTHAQTLNDGALNNYHGISTFTSSANVKVTEFMKALGYGAKNTYNRYCWEEGSPVSNLFLGLKYMVERDGTTESNMFFDTLHTYGNVALQENKAYLPLGFLADSALTSANFASSGDAFNFQNRLLRLASGVEADVWSKLSGDRINVTAYDATLISSGTSGYASYRTGSTAGTVVFEFTADRTGFACVNIANMSNTNRFTVSINGRELYTENYSLPQMLAVSDVMEGDIINVRFYCDANKQGSISAMAAVLDPELFWQAYDKLSASTLELTTFENTFVEGTIDCNRNGLLYTSIPQNGNWKAYVDGQETEIVLIGDCMIGLHLTEGTHTVTFRYENSSFELGWKISLACALIFAGIALPVYNNHRQKGKYEK